MQLTNRKKNCPCEDNDPKSDLNRQSRLFPRMHFEPQT